MFLALIPLVLSLAAGAMQYSAQQKQAATAQQVASYNSGLDEADAKQIDLDTQENQRQLRHEGRIYVSRQQAAYAAAGVTSTGSPLSVAATTAGRYEQKAQQMFRDSQAKQNRLHSAAQVGLLYGNSQAEGYKLGSYASALNGVAGAVNAYGRGVDSGAFSFARNAA